MSLVDFIHRTSKPTSPQKGRFYWVDFPDGETSIWFAPTDDEKDLILLNEDFKSVLENWKNEVEATYARKDEIPTVPTKVSELTNDSGYLVRTDIEDCLKSLDLEGYATEEWVEEQDFAKKSDIPDSTELTDSDYEKIAEMINAKSIELKWTTI